MDARLLTYVKCCKRSCLVVLFSALLVASASLVTARVPDTDQTTCYDGTGTVITCPSPGEPLAQDGSYNINPLSYTDNGDGTVTDNNTGLVWQKEDDGQTYNWYEANGVYDAQYNSSSTNVCGELMIGSQTGWRVPSNEELLSLVNYNVAAPGPAIDSVFTNTKSLSYCTSKTLQSSPWAAVNVHFSSGSNQAYHKGTAIYVRCVKSGNSQPQNLADNGDGTVSDSATGLTWQQEGPINMPWVSALNYCEELNLGNKTDWRLPNVKELVSLTLQDQYNPAIDTTFFPDTYSTNYWSSTTMVGNPQVAWVVNFDTGDIGHGGYSVNLYVRCVRGGGIPEPDRFTWPVDYPLGTLEFQEVLSSGHYGNCNDWPGEPDGCFWLSDIDMSTIQETVWRDVQPFQKHYWKYKTISGRHLGADYNIRSGDLDRGEFVYAVGKGVVSKVDKQPTWGNIIYIRHDTSFGTYTSMYAHVDFLESGAPTENTPVELGKPIARVGNGTWESCRNNKCRTVQGTWPAHLHFEIREGDNTDHGSGYTRCRNEYDTSAKCIKTIGPQGQIDPNAFISSHR